MFRPRIIAPLTLLALGLALYSIYWFVMAGRIERELYAWVEDQAQEGTEVKFDSVQVTGYPFRLIASVDAPDIFVSQGDRRPHWRGRELRAIAKPYSLRDIKIKFVGSQTIEFDEELGITARAPQKILMSFDGASMTMDLKLANGKIEQADVDLKDLTVSTTTMGDSDLSLNPFPDNMIVGRTQVHSRVRTAPEGSAGSIAHDLTLTIENLATDRDPPNGFSNEVALLVVDITRTSDDMVAFHNGSLRVDRHKARSDAKDVTIRKARLEWEPILIDISGDMKAPPGRDYSGNAALTIKGHRDLIRVLSEQGELSSLAAVLSGALLGALEMLGTASEDGTIEIPLNIDNGDVKFLFLPLTDLDELRKAARQD